MKKSRGRPPASGAEGVEVSVAEGVRRLVNLSPTVRFGLASGVANQSAVARGFLSELSLPKARFHAVLSAIKRLSGELEAPSFEADAMKVVGRSTISLRTDVAVVRLFTSAPVEKLRNHLRVLHFVQGTAATSLIVSSENLGEFAKKNRENVLEIRRDLTEIIIISPKELVSTPGVLLSLLSPLYSNGINAEEVLSSHNDTIIIVSAEQANRAFAVLNRVIRDARGMAEKKRQ